MTVKKNIPPRAAEGSEIHRILIVCLENRRGMFDFQIFQINFPIVKEDDF